MARRDLRGRVNIRSYNSIVGRSGAIDRSALMLTLIYICVLISIRYMRV